MQNLRKSILAIAACTAMASTSAAFAQQRPGSAPPSTDQPGGANRPALAPDAAPGARPGAVPAAAGMADAQQVDQQVKQQMMQIQQSPQGALDKLFVLQAGMGGMFEVAFAQQAQQKSQDPQVKQLAQQILQDHQQANQKLMPVAQALGVQLPQGLDSMHAQKLQTYAALDAKDYDKKFVCHNNEDHAKDVEAFKTAAATAQNPQVKQFAAETLPKLVEHHRMIQQVGQKLGVVQPGDAMPASGKMPADHGAPQGVTPRGDAGTGSGTAPNRVGGEGGPQIPDRGTGIPGSGTPSGNGSGGAVPR
ncbi:MAG TPA: DUF4142 domain-containing protein [Humisphaera sp.]